MQKANRLLLAAVALLGTSAVFAQSSVTLYGRVNTTVERQKIGDNNRTAMENNSSRFGFKGTEDLGGGLKAGFQLEAGFRSDDGAGSYNAAGQPVGITFARQSEVNLSGGFGMVRLGRFTPESYYATADYVSMHNHDTGTSADAFYVDSVSASNKVGYRTPSFGGFTLDAAVALHEKTTGGKNGYDLAANYNAGPLALGAGYSQVDHDKQLGLRALYSIGQFAVGGYYQRARFDLPGTRNSYRLAGMYTMGASEFHLNVGRAAKWSNVPNSAATQYTLGYNYNLSKRTKVYGYYTRVNNSAGAAYNVGRAGDDFSSLAVGVRHNF